ncbi:hypothetical protein R3I93_008399 [Phoxinus phoxinus]|uniref:LRAT domain-containing protein n=1 Tax=Phoxinus phoxinus TaxID=58324 RepID=A0AAN9HBN5_9TELE
MKFGDLIAYSRGLYTHYAVYTGKKDGQDMALEFTGESGLHSKAGATVKEGPLRPGGKVDNSLDKMGHTPQSEEKMRAAVQSFRDGKEVYGLLDNNCEHIATTVRYGKPISVQANTVLSTEKHFTNEMSENMGASFSPRLN